jgi:hypothetical protein
LLFAALLVAASAQAQWDITTPAPTTADLRGIDNVGKGVAWASGTNGTVLRTEDDGYMWQQCTVPPGAEHLDFRGIQGFDANTAIVMSSGKGDLSRLYKTTDGCQTWTLLFTDPEPEGFWDALVTENRGDGMVLLGDPVRSHFALWQVFIQPNAKIAVEAIKHRPKAGKSEGVFAASNTALVVQDAYTNFWFATGGKDGSRVYHTDFHYLDELSFTTWGCGRVPIGSKTASSGTFSLAFRATLPISAIQPTYIGVAVGGDYLRQEDPVRTAAFSSDNGETWSPAHTPPHGYRSAVAYDVPTKTWITVGPNGTDVSTDDGRNWRALRPDSAVHEAADADQHWNALSLPFAVGPHGRIGRLRESALRANRVTPPPVSQGGKP